MAKNLLYILAYKLTLKKLPQNKVLQNLAHKPTPKITWCVVWANNKRVYIYIPIYNALMKVHCQSICLGNNITVKLIMKRM